MKAKQIIWGVLNQHKDTELKGLSTETRKMLTKHIYKELSKHYHIFKKNELIVDDE